MIMNMPMASDSTMIWDISSELYTMNETVSTMPRDITNGYVVKLNDTFYMLGGGSVSSGNVTAQKTYKYVDETWVEDTVLGNVTLNKKYITSAGCTDRDIKEVTTGGVVSNNSMIYYTPFNSSNQTQYGSGKVYMYDGEQKTSKDVYFTTNSSNRYRYGNIGIATSGTAYKTVSIGYYDTRDIATSAFDFNYALSWGAEAGSGTSSATIDSSMFGFNNEFSLVQPHCQGVYHNGFYVFLVSKRNTYVYSSNVTACGVDYNYYLMLLDSSGSEKRVIEVPDGAIRITDMVAIGDYIYITNEASQVMRWSYNTMKWERISCGIYAGGAFPGSLVEHDGYVHRFYGTGHTRHKLYRKAKTYAPTGTKIYLPYESKALSGNLETIEGGYIVKESGNIQLAIYDN